MKLKIRAQRVPRLELSFLCTNTLSNCTNCESAMEARNERPAFSAGAAAGQAAAGRAVLGLRQDEAHGRAHAAGRQAHHLAHGRPPPHALLEALHPARPTVPCHLPGTVPFLTSLLFLFT
jgi:hypothetical protein